VTLGEIELHARTTFAPFVDPACASSWAVLARSLRPRVEDIVTTFIPRAVSMMTRHLETEWSAGAEIIAGVSRTELHASVRWARDVTDAGWPRKYRWLAEYLVPDVAWMRLQFRAPHEQRGIVFDGFVFTGGRWRWFPRPWRAVPTTFVAWGAD
jgi:hypothetical protein